MPNLTTCSLFYSNSIKLTKRKAEMQTIQIAELKAKFSEIIKHIKDEKEEYIIQYGAGIKK